MDPEEQARRAGTLAVVGVLVVTADPDAAPRSPAPTDEQVPVVHVLADLPQGAPADVPVLTGRTLSVGDRSVVLERRASMAVTTYEFVFVTYPDGRVVRVDRSSLVVDLVTGSAAGRPVVDPGGNVVAWQADRDGRAAVAIASLHRSWPADRDQQLFPAEPSCCENPLAVNGFTQYGELFVSLPATWQVWRWDIDEGQEGVPYEVPDSDDFVTEIRGLAGWVVADVTANELVVTRLSATERDRTVFAVGTVSGARFRATERVRAELADFRDPRAARIVYWTADGRGHVAGRTSGLGVRPGAERTVVPLALPPTLEAGALFWEGRHHFLVDVTERATTTRALVRCDARSGECELVTPLPPAAEIAGP